MVMGEMVALEHRAPLEVGVVVEAGRVCSNIGVLRLLYSELLRLHWVPLNTIRIRQSKPH